MNLDIAFGTAAKNQHAGAPFGLLQALRQKLPQRSPVCALAFHAPRHDEEAQALAATGRPQRA
jgi:hypothetical protein